MQPDGKMLVAGRSFSFSTHTYTGLIARFNSNGSVDTTFGTNGSTSASISGVFSLAVQTDRKILAGGSQGNDPAFAIVRLHADGSPDLSFGSGGVLIHHPTLSDQMWFVKIRFDNLIFAGGHSSAIAGDPRGALLSIGNGGTLAQGALYPQQNAFWNMTFQPDGKALVVGASHLPRSGFMIRRYTDINTPDLTFNGGLTFAKFLPDNVPEASGINAIAMTGDNKIVAVGSVTEEDNRTSGWRLAVARFHSGLPVPHPERFDFDGDRKADASIFRPSNGQWWYLRSSDGVASAFQFGTGTDMITPGDYTGDGRTDIGIWRPSTGEWFILRSESFTYYSVPFGTSGDIPRPSDFDGDGKTDLIVYRPSTGVWYRTNSIGINSFREFGKGEPITGDFDGDGRSDLAVYRPATGEWSYESSRTSLRVSFHWGLPSDLPAPADFDGDGMTDIAVYRPSNGTWYVVNSSDGSFRIVNFGVGEDKPVPADYDGDGKFDLAVFRPSSGIWYLLRSTAGFTAVQFGLAEDIPIPGAFLD